MALKKSLSRGVIKGTALLEDLEKVKAKQSEIEKNIKERNSNLANLYSAAEFVTPIKQYC